jgi:glutathione S-transferase
MLTLCGFGASNYYNKVKLVLLEKGIAFEEDLKWVGQADLEASPLGKIPYLKTGEGSLSESAVMVEYLEHKYTAHPLLPQDPFAAAKARELHLYLDLHLELVARELYAEAFIWWQGQRCRERESGQATAKEHCFFCQIGKVCALHWRLRIDLGRLHSRCALACHQCRQQNHLRH